jgi:hypothetical protein
MKNEKYPVLLVTKKMIYFRFASPSPSTAFYNSKSPLDTEIQGAFLSLD